jgi:hypothetical protein
MHHFAFANEKYMLVQQPQHTIHCRIYRQSSSRTSIGSNIHLAAIFNWQQHSIGSNIQLAAIFNWQQYSIGSDIQLAAIFNSRQHVQLLEDDLNSFRCKI